MNTKNAPRPIVAHPRSGMRALDSGVRVG